MTLYCSNTTKGVIDKLKGKIICLEGNIGVGKTTLGTSLELYLSRLGYKVKLYREPIDYEKLERFIKGEIKCIDFQLEMLIKLYEIGLNASKYIKDNEAIAILDRSLIGSFVFSNILYERKQMYKEEFTSYNILFDKFIDASKPVDIMIYMSLEPKLLMKRIEKRGIDIEKSYTLEYIESLDNKYISIIKEHKHYKSLYRLYTEEITFLDGYLSDDYLFNLVKDL